MWPPLTAIFRRPVARSAYGDMGSSTRAWSSTMTRAEWQAAVRGVEVEQALAHDDPAETSEPELGCLIRYGSVGLRYC